MTTEPGGRPLIQRPFIYGLLLMTARILPVAIIFMASALLPPDDFGSLAVLITCVALASLISDAGTDNAAGWRASHAKSADERAAILAALVYTRCTVAALATFALTVPQLRHLPGGVAEHAAILLAALVGNVLASYNAARRIRMRVDGAGEPSAILREKVIVSGAFAVWLLFAPPEPLPLIAGYLGANIVGPAIAAQKSTRGDFRTTTAQIARLLSGAAPFIATTLSAALTWRASTFILADTNQLAQAGFLTLAYYPIQALSTVPNLAAPLLLIKRETDTLSFRQSALTAGITGSALAVAGFIATASLTADWSPVDPPDDAIHAVQVLLLAMPFLWLNPILVTRLRATAGAWVPVLAPVTAAMAAIALAFAYVPTGGAAAAAAVIAGAEILVFVLLAVITARTRQPTANSLLPADS